MSDKWVDKKGRVIRDLEVVDQTLGCIATDPEGNVHFNRSRMMKLFDLSEDQVHKLIHKMIEEMGGGKVQTIETREEFDKIIAEQKRILREKS